MRGLPTPCRLRAGLALSLATAGAVGSAGAQAVHTPAKDATPSGGEDEDRDDDGGRPLPSSTRFMAGTPGQRPQRIPAGGTGELVIVLALHDTAVLLPEAPFSLTYERQQGALGLGAWEREPPRPGRLHAGTRGTSVYDDTAVVSIPVAVAPHARAGLHPATVRVTAHVHDGETGQILGQHTGDVACEVLVAGAGTPGTSRAAEPRSRAPAGRAPRPATPRELSPPSAGSRPDAAQPAEVTPAAPERAAELPGPSPAVPSGGAGSPSPRLWTWLGALAAALAVAWVIRRRR